MPEKNRSIEDYKMILREALDVKDQLSVQAKEKILTFKNTLNDYIEAVDEFSDSTESPGDNDEVYEVEKSDNKMEMFLRDLQEQSDDLLKEIALVKKTFS